MNYLIVGHGRMGRAIDAIAAARGHRRAGILGAGEAPERGAADVAFEFTRPEAAPDNVARLLAAGIPAVCGTTGWDPGSLADPAGGTGWIVAPNFSIGMHLFARVAAEAARTLGRSGLYQPWIHEVHHRGKRDNPSGTALHLAGILRDEGRGSAAWSGDPATAAPCPPTRCRSSGRGPARSRGRTRSASRASTTRSG